VPVVVRNGALVIEALVAARTLFPFPLRGVDFDNDGAFMNEAVVDWCRAEGLEVTRSRAYRKNDQAWVEQKNGAIVRRLVGYGRLEGLASVQALARLYAASRLHTNLFQPSFKLKEKKRIGARVIKRYHPPVPPTDRVLAHAEVGEESKVRLRQLHAQADPVLLLAKVRAAQALLGERVDQRGTQTAQLQPIIVDPDRFAASLKTAWREGERRATHRRPYRRRKPVPKRPSMLDDVQEQIRAWLDREPALSAVAVLTRLKSTRPEQFTDRHVRTVQRAVKAWRGHQARRIILESATAIEAGIGGPLHSGDVIPPPPDPHPHGSPPGVHSYSPRIASSGSGRPLRDARVPSVDSVDDPSLPRHETLSNIPV
jgi:hypothetical protein